jgi:hypothetical protein
VRGWWIHQLYVGKATVFQIIADVVLDDVEICAKPCIESMPKVFASRYDGWHLTIVTATAATAATATTTTAATVTILLTPQAVHVVVCVVKNMGAKSNFIELIRK